MRYLSIAFCLLFALACFTGCKQEQETTPMFVENSHLYKDLTSERRDGIRRAVLFVNKIHESEMVGYATSRMKGLTKKDLKDVNAAKARGTEDISLQDWKERRKPYVRWLRAQDKEFFERIQGAYEDFWKGWSPYYLDWDGS